MSESDASRLGRRGQRRRRAASETEEYEAHAERICRRKGATRDLISQREEQWDKIWSGGHIHLLTRLDAAFATHTRVCAGVSILAVFALGTSSVRGKALHICAGFAVACVAFV